MSEFSGTYVPPHMRHTGNSGPERALGDSFEGSNEDDDDWKYCSSFEGRERQRLLDVHALEATSGTAHLPMNRRRLDPKKAVRKFVRSGSDNLHVSAPSRSLEQLVQCCEYLSGLWDQVCTRAGGSKSSGRELSVAYVFVMDRLAAVRQDITTQQYSCERTCKLYYDMTQFYLLSGAFCTRREALQSDSDSDSGAESTQSQQSQWFDRHLHEKSLVSCTAAGLSLIHLVLQQHSLLHTLVQNRLLPSQVLVWEAGLWEVSQLCSLSHFFEAAVEDGCNDSDSGSEGKTAMLMQLRSLALPGLLSCKHTHAPMIDTAQSSSTPTTPLAGGIAGALKRNCPSEAIRVVLGAIMWSSGEICGPVLARLLPGLRLWRLLLVEVSANKGEGVSLPALARRIGFRLHGEGEVEEGREEREEMSEHEPFPFTQISLAAFEGLLGSCGMRVEGVEVGEGIVKKVILRTHDWTTEHLQAALLGLQRLDFCFFA